MFEEVVVVYGGWVLSFGCDYIIFVFFDLCLMEVVFVVVVKVVMDLGVVM